MKKIMFSLFSFILVTCFMVGCNFNIKQNNKTSNTKGIYDKFQYKIINNSVEILSYDDNEIDNITVPKYIEGCSVKTLGKNAFYQCQNAVSIVLPDTLITIKGSPFYRCYSLQKINIPQNVKYIEANPFFRCSALEKIVVETNNEKFADVEGVLFDKKKTVLIAYPEGRKSESYTIPATVKKLNIDSFGYDTHLQKITIMSNVVDFPEDNMFVFPDKITLVIESGSSAEEYVKKHGLNYEYLAG